MKKHPLILCVLVCLSLSVSVGCNQETSSSQAQVSQTQEIAKSKHNVIQHISSEADLSHIASSLEELVADSDFIAEIKVKETSSYVPNDTVKIYTEITPEIVKTYKGEYNGNSLVLGGGYMKYQDYMKCKGVAALSGNTANTSKLTEEELENGEVYFDWLNNYVPEVGDTLIFFGYELDNGDYHITNSYQGSFLCENGNVSNQAFVINQNEYTEPLVEDLQKLFQDSMQSETVSRQISGETDVLTIPQTEFTDKLNEIL